MGNRRRFPVRSDSVFGYHLSVLALTLLSRLQDLRICQGPPMIGWQQASRRQDPKKNVASLVSGETKGTWRGMAWSRQKRKRNSRRHRAVCCHQGPGSTAGPRCERPCGVGRRGRCVPEGGMCASSLSGSVIDSQKKQAFHAAAAELSSLRASCTV